MNRKIHLVHHKQKDRLTGFTEVPLTDVDSIVNYSVDMMYCSALNKVDKSKINQYMDAICNKIRYGGQVVLVISDIKKLCNLYLSKSIDDGEFFEAVADSHQLLTEHQIVHTMTSKSFELLSVEKNKTDIAMSFGRKSE